MLTRDTAEERAAAGRAAADVAVKILDIGCGRHKTPGAVGIDSNPRSDADVLHDLDSVPYPFPDDEFDLIVGNQVIEHVDDILAVMAELYRIARPGAVIRLDTPHYSDIASYTDPTHRHHLTTESFSYFTGRRTDFDFYSEVRLRPLTVRVTMLKLWRALGFEFLVNLGNRYPSARFGGCSSACLPRFVPVAMSFKSPSL